jgi:outer membrane lipoprotein-sorting protein
VLSLGIKVGTFVGLFLCCQLAADCQQSSGRVSGSTAAAPLSAEQVARSLEEKDQQRAAALQEFSSQRVYRMHYHGLPGDYDAQMVVELTYRAPNAKQFRVVSQSGSTFLINHILKKLLEGEQEFISDAKRQQNALNTQNYNFALAGYELTANGPQYILRLSPKKKNKFLYGGKIWVDAKDFAVVRIEAEPSENPSIWIKRTKIEQKYMKVNDFWLPAWDHTQSEIRLGGEATLSIEYKNYRILRASPLPGTERARAGGN